MLLHTDTAGHNPAITQLNLGHQRYQFISPTDRASPSSPILPCCFGTKQSQSSPAVAYTQKEASDALPQKRRPPKRRQRRHLPPRHRRQPHDIRTPPSIREQRHPRGDKTSSLVRAPSSYRRRRGVEFTRCRSSGVQRRHLGEGKGEGAGEGQRGGCYY